LTCINASNGRRDDPWGCRKEDGHMDHNLISDRTTVRNLVLVIGSLVGIALALVVVVSFVT
jgi:hypothetical protein